MPVAHPKRRSVDTQALAKLVARNVAGVMHMRGFEAVDLAPVLGVEISATYARLRGETPFKAYELLLLADALNVEPSVFLEELRQKAKLLFASSRPTSLTVVPGTGQPTTSISRPLVSIARIK